MAVDPEILKQFLRQEIEKKAGFKPITSTDFDRLAAEISDTCHDRVSSTTLKRIYGYIEGWQKPRPGVIDVLARYLGYKSGADMMCEKGIDCNNDSGYLYAPHLNAGELAADARISLRWYPDREIIVRHISGNGFVVERVKNSRCKEGATFTCEVIVQERPLLMMDYKEPGSKEASTVYECGRRGGIVFEVIK